MENWQACENLKETVARRRPKDGGVWNIVIDSLKHFSWGQGGIAGCGVWRLAWCGVHSVAKCVRGGVPTQSQYVGTLVLGVARCHGRQSGAAWLSATLWGRHVPCKVGARIRRKPHLLTGVPRLPVTGVIQGSSFPRRCKLFALPVITFSHD